MEYLSKHKEMFIAIDEIDFAGRLKPSAILQYFQDLVEYHSWDLGISQEQMIKKGKSWILSRMRVEIAHYPKVGEMISATTFPHKPGNAEAKRSFYLYDNKGSLFAKGISKWCVLDIKTKRIVRFREFLDFPTQNLASVQAIDFPARAFNNDDSTNEFVAEYSVNNSDLDTNYHMNNAKYGDIILNTLSYDEIINNDISSFDISFLSELKYGEKYNTFRKTDGDDIKIKAIKENKAVFLANISLRKVKNQSF